MTDLVSKQPDESQEVYQDRIARIVSLAFKAGQNHNKVKEKVVFNKFMVNNSDGTFDSILKSNQP